MRDARRQTPDAKGCRSGGPVQYPGQTGDAEGQLGRLGLFRQAAGETREHSLHMLQLLEYRGNSLFGGHAQEGCHEQVGLQFACGTQSDIDETAKLSIPEATASFGDVRCDRHRRPPTLRYKTKSFRFREPFSDPVYALDDDPTSLPNLELSKVLHAPLVPEKRSSRNLSDTSYASGVWRLASGVSSYDPAANAS
jgi:hypothetical protein